jgi:4-amino-4-deoxy-L-arabinose transferase-like glycosyltransferase
MTPLHPIAQIRRWYAWAVLCFVPTLFFYYVGEEAVFTLNSMEMWQRQEFMNTVMYGSLGGGGNGRPPLFSWLMIPLAQLVGWNHVLVASRLITVGATLGTSLTLAWLAQQLWRDKAIAWMAALLYLVTADVLLYRGWLSYADPLFAMWVVLAIALTWVACLRASSFLLAAAALVAFAALLTKALTVYIFLGVCWLVLQTQPDYRRFLRRPQAWCIYAVALVLPLIWFKLGSHDVNQEATLSRDVIEKLVVPQWGDYLFRLLSYPLEMFLRLMPASVFIGFVLWRKRSAADAPPIAVRMALWMALLNFLPYWLAPSGGARYVLPIYALLVLPAAYFAVHQFARLAVKKWVIGLLTVATATNLMVYPYYQKKVRGQNYAQMAQQIVSQYGQFPLFATNVSSVGLAVVAHIDSLRFAQPAVVWPPADFQNGIVIAHAQTDVAGTLLRTLQIDNDSVLLICRGAACAAAK